MHASAWNRFDHKHFVTLRSGRHTGCRGICVVESRCAKSHQNRRSLLCGPRIEDPVQLHSPGILTPMWEPMLGNGPDREARMKQFVRDTPLRRFGAPEEVAAVALLLASDDVGYM